MRMLVSQTALRFSMGGGGTDVPAFYEKDQEGGFWTAATINLFLRMTVNLRIDDFYVLKYSTTTERVEVIEQIENVHLRSTLTAMKMEHWQHPLYGTSGLEINVISDVQSKSGLGVSSAMIVGLLQILHQIRCEGVDPRTLAEEAYNIEHNLVGDTSTGKQDMYAAAIGGLKSYEVDRFGHVRIIPLPIDTHTRAGLEGNILLFGTKLKREATANEAIKDAQKDPESYCRYLSQIKEIGIAQRKALLNGDADQFGSLLNDHWVIKKKYGGAPDARIEEAYAEAIKAGALGGKVIGAATQGGYMMYYCPRNEAKASLRTIMQDLGMIELPWAFVHRGSQIVHID